MIKVGKGMKEKDGRKKGTTQDRKEGNQREHRQKDRKTERQADRRTGRQTDGYEDILLTFLVGVSVTLAVLHEWVVDPLHDP